MKSIITAIGILTVISAVWIFGSHRPHPALAEDAPASTRIPANPDLTVKTIAFHTARVKRDPRSALDFGMLASAYLKRCRETGDIADALKAEQAARRSLAIRTRHNATAYDDLALSQFTQHRFAEARESAGRALGIEPEDTQARTLTIEVDTEVGDYESAERGLDKELTGVESPYLKSVRARLLELTGHLPEALTLLRQAQSGIDANYDADSESVAWFHMRVGNILAQLGRSTDADQSYADALTLFPEDIRTLTARARLHAGLQDWPGAIRWAEASAAIVPTPEILAILGDAYAGSGDKARAEEQYRLIRKIGQLSRAQGGVYDRQRALFEADHRRNIGEAISLARAELLVRHDVYAYDTLAWATIRSGKIAEASAIMEKALAHGTQDASLFYHAGVIAAARGDETGARDFLTRALQLNPNFSAFGPADARLILSRLQPSNKPVSSIPRHKGNINHTAQTSAVPAYLRG